jgi:phosphatidyl-myo-inositol dimannoside synthase
MRFPVLCTINQSPGNGGVARVSLLVWQVMRRLLQDHCRGLSLSPPESEVATYLEKCRFVARIVTGQVRGEFEWLFFDHLGPAVTQLLVPRPYRRPYGIFLHSVEVWNELSPTKLHTLKGATVRIANSRYTAERVQAAHANLGPIEVCPLALLPESLMTSGSSGSGVDAELLRQIRENSVLIVGRINSTERHKGHLQLIHSWPHVLKHVPDAQLVIVGRGDDMTFLKSKVRDAGSEGRVLFTNWVSEHTLAAIYERVAVYAMPSNGEGFGLVFLEAMKHRLPCIGSTSDASREIVAEGKSGFLVNQADEEMLVQRIVTLLTEPGLRRRMGEESFRRLNECFSFEQFEKRLVCALKPLTLTPFSTRVEGQK